MTILSSVYKKGKGKKMSDDFVECQVCGRDGLPPTSCNTCHGTASIQSRAYKLSDKKTEENRYENLGPKTSDPLWTNG
jgi:predicted nucleic acid binding AN1-type Zn finger protein